MILAEKISKLRKNANWSQEDLAEKMTVSRQSVSKWESANSIPDLNKIIMLAGIFDVSTDYLLKDDIESAEPLSESSQSNGMQISLEQAIKYVEDKTNTAQLIAKGVFLCICSVIPLFAFLAMAETNQLGMTSDIAATLGVITILIMVSIGISFFIRTNQYESDLAPIDSDPFDLAYGVHSIFKDKLQNFRGTYNLRLSLAISMFIFSFAPVIFVNMLSDDSGLILMMLIVTILMIAIGTNIVIQISAKYDAYNKILLGEESGTEKSKRIKRSEKLGAFYWPLLTTIYIGWSLWSMNWGVTWIIWPVGAILFVALVGLMELFDKEAS